jgi:hypothetical protein
MFEFEDTEVECSATSVSIYLSLKDKNTRKELASLRIFREAIKDEAVTLLDISRYVITTFARHDVLLKDFTAQDLMEWINKKLKNQNSASSFDDREENPQETIAP